MWTEDPQRRVAGGVHFFREAASTAAYVEKHTARLASFSITDISATSAGLNEGLSRIDHAVLER